MPKPSIQEATLMVLNEHARTGADAKYVLPLVGEKLGMVPGQPNPTMERAILTHWHRLLCMGYVAWGGNLREPVPPFFQMTDRGNEALKHLGRDPSNPEGYMNYLRGMATLNPVAESYINEALQTYASNCHKATAVMIGAAVESIVKELAEKILEKMPRLDDKIKEKLRTWQAKAVFDGVTEAIKANRYGRMDHKLSASFDYNWATFAHHIRAGRNEAGHPTSIDPVTPEDVHGSMLIFPNLVRLARELGEWVDGLKDVN